jgi:aspartate aminotransferase
MGLSSTSAMVNAVAELKSRGVSVLDLGAGEPHFSTPGHIREAANSAMVDNKTKYTPVAGTTELREAIASRHHLDFGSAYSVEEVIACPGGKYALFTALQVLVDEGDEVILPVPYWVSFKDMIQFAGGTCVFVDTVQPGFTLTPEMVEAAITPRTKALILNYPNNPSGVVLDPHTLADILQVAARNNVWVISDECYAYLTYSGRPLSAGEHRETNNRLIVVGSLSKTYAMTGWRLGFALAPPSVIQAMETMQSQAISCPCSITQAAGVAALTGPQDCVFEMRAAYHELRDLALAGLAMIPGITVTIPGGAFYLFPDISEQLKVRGLTGARELSRQLLNGGVATVAGEGFGSPKHIRLSFAVSKTELTRGMQRMQEIFTQTQ